jgi:hypothetical protein
MSRLIQHNRSNIPEAIAKAGNVFYILLLDGLGVV